MRIAQMSESEAKEICTWNYPSNYACYNLPNWEECCAQGYAITNQEKRQREFYAIREADELIGYFRLKSCKDGLELALGLRPDCCGKHLGEKALQIAIRKAEEEKGEVNLYLRVRCWNRRAICVYQRGGFEIETVLPGKPGQGEMLWMRRQKKSCIPEEKRI